MNADAPLLELDECHVRFGGLTAVGDLTTDGGRALVGLIGPNGAGKTSVFNLITGVYSRRRATSISPANRCRTEAIPDHRSWASPALSRTSVCSRR